MTNHYRTHCTNASGANTWRTADRGKAIEQDRSADVAEDEAQRPNSAGPYGPGETTMTDTNTAGSEPAPPLGLGCNELLGGCDPERNSACGLTECAGKPECATCSAMRRNGAPKEADAYEIGAKGGPAHDGERLAFEAWMRGHCWALCATWDGKSYRSDAEQGGDVDPRAMRTRQLWAAWRDRAALARLKAPNA